MWVSRRAWDAMEDLRRAERYHLHEEIDWLRQQLADALISADEAQERAMEAVAAAQDHARRMERVDRRLPEAPAQRASVKDEPMPEKVQRLLETFPADGSARGTLVSSIDKARREGLSWDTIHERVLAEMPPEIAQRLEASP